MRGVSGSLQQPETEGENVRDSFTALVGRDSRINRKNYDDKTKRHPNTSLYYPRDYCYQTLYRNTILVCIPGIYQFLFQMLLIFRNRVECATVREKLGVHTVFWLEFCMKDADSRADLFQFRSRGRLIRKKNVSDDPHPEPLFSHLTYEVSQVIQICSQYLNSGNY